PGSYPVWLAIAEYFDPGNPQGHTDYAKVAAARLVIRNEPVTAWRVAVLDGQDEAALADDEYYGYPVDSGTGAFASPEVLDGLYDDLDEIADLSYDMVYAGRDIGEYVDARTGNNLVMFTSGGGDGHYPTWAGFTAEGEIACFLTEFVTLTPPNKQADDRDATETDTTTATERPTTGQRGVLHDAVGRVEVRISDQKSGVAHHPRATATVADGYALTGGGAQAHWRGAGSLLWHSAPLPDFAGYAAGAKDHGYSAPCDLSAYAVGIRIAPRA
ncbi:MAG: DUF4241 domain-containing protein, partial [Actinocrinis sp.]